MSALKLAISLQLLVFSLFLLTIPVFADEQSLSKDNYTAPVHSNYTIQNLQHAMLCELAGISPLNNCVGQKTDGKKVYTYLYDRVPGGGAIGGVTNVMVAMYQNPPTSSIQYLADIGQNFGLAKPAYAQVGGSGAGIIEPIKALWQFSRNLTYVLFIIVFVVVGFMIMFRTKINPQTVISAQSALPGLVIGLILVTFSYFIAALIIDTAFLGIQVIANIFINVGNNFFQVQELAKGSNIFEMFISSIRFPQNFGDITGGIYQTISTAANGAGGGGFTALAPVVIGAIIGGIMGAGIFSIPGAAIGAVVGGVAIPVIGFIIPLILIIALLIQFFRLLLKLISSYISLLVVTIFGPFLILFSSIPGKGGALGVWWKTLLGNALVFPAVFAAFLFAGLILATDNTLWQASPPLFGGLSTVLLKVIIAYGIILGTPAIPDMVKKALGVPDLKGIPEAAMAGAASGFTTARSRVSDLPFVRNLRYQREYAERQGFIGGASGITAATPHAAKGWQGAIAKWLGGGR